MSHLSSRNCQCIAIGCRSHNPPSNTFAVIEDCCLWMIVPWWNPQLFPGSVFSKKYVDLTSPFMWLKITHKAYVRFYDPTSELWKHVCNGLKHCPFMPTKFPPYHSWSTYTLVMQKWQLLLDPFCKWNKKTEGDGVLARDEWDWELLFPRKLGKMDWSQWSRQN